MKNTFTSIKRDLICGWMHFNPDINAGSSLAASSVASKLSSLQEQCCGFVKQCQTMKKIAVVIIKI